MSKAFKPVGLPCVGGKTELASILKEVIENTCFTDGISTYISACGGGGKDILALNPEYFGKLIYNEIEKPVAMLMRALTQVGGLNEIHKKVNEIFERALSVETYDDLSDKRKREARMRFMFDYIYNLYANDYTDKLGVDENPDDLFTIAAHGVILIYGSVQSNRKNILYRDKGRKRDFYKRLYEQSTYIEKLNKIREKASNITAIHGNCFPLIEKYKSHKDTLIYIDPPYWNCSNDYTNTFSFDDHIKLTELCADAECKIMISMHEAGIAPYVSNLVSRDGWYMYELKPISHSTIGRNVINKSKQATLMGTSLSHPSFSLSSLKSKIDVIKTIGTNEYSRILRGILDNDTDNGIWLKSDLECLRKYDDEATGKLSELKLKLLRESVIDKIIDNAVTGAIDYAENHAVDYLPKKDKNNVNQTNGVAINKFDKIHSVAESNAKHYTDMKKIIKNKIDYRIDAVTEYVFSNFEIDHEDFQLITINSEGRYNVFRETEDWYYSEQESVYRIIREAIPIIFLEKYAKLKEQSDAESNRKKITGFSTSIFKDTATDDVLQDVWNTLSSLHFINSDEYDVDREQLGLIEDKELDVDFDTMADDIEAVENIVKRAVVPSFKRLLYNAYYRQKLVAKISDKISADAQKRKKQDSEKKPSADDDNSKGSVKKILKPDRCKEMLERMEKAMETM